MEPSLRKESANGSTVLSIEGLTAGYGRQVIIRDICLEIQPMHILAVIGANGSGKSTLAKAIMGLCRVFDGKVEVGGRNLAGESTSHIAKAGVGYVPQLDQIFPGLSVKENLEMGGYVIQRKDRGTRLSAVLELFPELKSMYRKKAQQLSGGQRGMVGIGRALMASPKYLVLDEPTAGLSPIYRNAVWDHIERAAGSGVGVLVVEQDARRAVAHSSRCCVFANGRKIHDVESTALTDMEEVAGFFLGQ